jgi:hypothetical protein
MVVLVLSGELDYDMEQVLDEVAGRALDDDGGG